MKSIKLVCWDVDGVLSDGGLTYLDLPYGQIGRSITFHTHDGHGLAMLRKAGIRLAFVTGNSSAAVAARAAKLGVEFCIQNCADKLATVRHIAARCELGLDEVAYVGDDLGDVEAMKACALAIAPADARPEARAVSGFITKCQAGRGAGRDACDIILHWNAEDQRWLKTKGRYI